MTDTSNRGLGSDNMSQADKDRIHSEGGKASHSGGNTPNSSSSASTSSTGRGSNLTDADRAKGGRNSHSNQNS